ncbi:hypothetical protein V6N12_022021 [Hibiscus sabdariffa]|uniref:Aldehyde dehydrogenase domain-containing protein n=1 Tax=Hibiscus sabdariffa TaxID=183260 RepID=A0ABR2FTY9_9ROSI
MQSQCSDPFHMADDNKGLGGAVVSKDVERYDRVLCGSIVHNHPCFCQAPFGGVKWSGFGRELGEWGLENHWSVKQVREYVSDEQWGWYEPPKQ